MALAVLASVIVAGCGGGSTSKPEAPKPLRVPRKIDITLDGYPGPETVGILMAYHRSYFQKVGLEVWIRTPQSRLRPLPYVVEREVALAVSHQLQVVMAVEKGAPVTAFGSLVSKPTAALIWLGKSKIGGIADLKGKTIAITGLPFEVGLLEAALKRGGLTLDDVKIERADYELTSALLSGHADAILGSWNLEGAELEAKGLEPKVIRLTSLGIPGFEESVLIARPDRLSGEPTVIQLFMTALARGTAAAIEDPEAAARLVASSKGEKLTRPLRAEVRATLPLLSPDGKMNTDQADALVGWMHEEGLIEREPSVSDFLTNDYLAQQP